MALAPHIPARPYYMISLLDALRALGGSAPSTTIYDWMIERGVARAGDLQIIQKDGGTRFRKEVRFARKELFDAGLLANDGPGEWILTPAGQDTQLDHASANEVVRLNQQLRPLRRSDRPAALLKRTFNEERNTGGPTTGPRPTTWSGAAGRNILGPAYTYLMRFAATSVWKVGHAKDLRKRLREVNRHIPHEVIDGKWALVRHQEWANSVLAHAMEQLVFQELGGARTEGERVQCSEETLDLAWSHAVGAVRT